MSRRKCNACVAVIVAVVLAVMVQQICQAGDGKERTAACQDSVEKIEKALRDKVKVEFVETPLAEVLDFLSDTHDIQIKLDQKALDEMGIGTDAAVTYSLVGITLESALNAMLRDLELTWVIRDEMLVVTTQAEADSILNTKVYPVADLLSTEAGTQTAFDFEALIDVITGTVQPESWSDVGGPGSVAPFEKSGALVCRQTYHVHRKIAKLLADLRAVSTSDAGHFIGGQ